MCSCLGREYFFVFKSIVGPNAKQFRNNGNMQTRYNMSPHMHQTAGLMHLSAGLVGRKAKMLKNVLVFKTYLKGSRSHGDAKESLQLSEPEHFLVTLRSFFLYMRVILRHFGMTSGLLCGSIRYMKVFFKKHTFYQSI